MVRLFRHAGIIVILLAGIAAGGCENSISPFSERAEYSVYGALALGTEIQFIRVKALDTPIITDTAATLNATVTLENLSDGTKTTLRDSTLIFGDDGVVTHNFWTRRTIEPDTEYRLVVEGEDGVRTEVTATTPTGTPPESIPEEGDCLTSFTVLFRNASAPYEASIGFRYGGITYWADQQRSFSLPGQSEQGIRFTPESILSTAISSIDNPETPFQYEPRCWRLDSRHLLVAYTYLGPDWFGQVPEPGTSFDPTESRRVKNGLGFFGGYRRDTLAVSVDTSSAISLR